MQSQTITMEQPVAAAAFSAPRVTFDALEFNRRNSIWKSEATSAEKGAVRQQTYTAELTPPATPPHTAFRDQTLEQQFETIELSADLHADIVKVEHELTSLSVPAESMTPIQDNEKISSDILDVMQRYGQHLSGTAAGAHAEAWLGKSLFMNVVRAQVEKNQAIRLIMPAFPWKSVNKVEKVTGILPDFGEELALFRLNQMCEDIKTVYPMGGKVYIATDGLVFDDVVGIPDEDTWAYGEGLIELASRHGLKNLGLLRVMDILGYTKSKTLDKELYLSLVQQCRDELLARYGRTEAEVRQMMKDDPDTLLTYCGFIRFLEADLKFSPVTAATRAISGSQYRKTVKKVAIQMMIRAESFTELLKAHCPEYVRLSIHPSTGAVKLSVPLIIQASGEFPRSPWHSSLALATDGSYSTVHSRDVSETHSLMRRDGRGYYFRENSTQWDFEDDDIVCEPRYPNQLIVRPARLELVGTKVLLPRQVSKLEALRAAHTVGPVLAAGFAPYAYPRL